MDNSAKPCASPVSFVGYILFRMFGRVLCFFCIMDRLFPQRWTLSVILVFIIRNNQSLYIERVVATLWPKMAPSNHVTKEQNWFIMGPLLQSVAKHRKPCLTETDPKFIATPKHKKQAKHNHILLIRIRLSAKIPYHMYNMWVVSCTIMPQSGIVIKQFLL